MVPNPEECLRLLHSRRVPEHIIRHSRVVHRVALYLCRHINLRGGRLGQAEVEAGALLHDIAKMESLLSGENHSQAGALLLSRLGYPEVAEIVRQHVLLGEGSWEGPVGEAAVVHYADKRVMHTRIVSLGERFLDLEQRYGTDAARRSWLEELRRKSLALERRIFSRLPVSPESLLDLAAGSDDPSSS